MEMIIGLVFVAAGAAMFLHALWQLLTALESRKWPAAPGVVTGVQVKEERGSESGRVYLPVVSYRFRVDGVEHFGNRAFFGGSTTYAFAWAFVKKYPAGTAVQVHYNPEKPSDSVLEPGVKWPLMASFAIVLFILAAGILALRSA